MAVCSVSEGWGVSRVRMHTARRWPSPCAGNRTWRAYFSTQGAGAVNARDRIGTGPWFNAKGQLVAQNVADVHGDNVRDRNQVNKDGALNEKGEIVNGRGDQPNRHDLEPSAQFPRLQPGEPGEHGG